MYGSLKMIQGSRGDMENGKGLIYVGVEGE